MVAISSNNPDVTVSPSSTDVHGLGNWDSDADGRRSPPAEDADAADDTANLDAQSERCELRLGE